MEVKWLGTKYRINQRENRCHQRTIIVAAGEGALLTIKERAALKEFRDIRNGMNWDIVYYLVLVVRKERAIQSHGIDSQP